MSTDDEADRYADKAKRSREKADKLKQKAKRLLKRATEWDEKANKWDEHAKRLRIEYWNQFDSYPEFGQACHALYRNDPDITFAPLRDALEPYGHGNLLGQALCNNTHVTSLHLDLARLLSPFLRNEGERKIKEFIGPLIHFVESSPSLRHVSLYGQADYATVDEILVTAFLVACRKTPNLEKVRLGCKITPPAFRCMMESTMMRDVWLSFDEDYTRNEILSIALTVSQSSSVKSLGIDTGEDVDWWKTETLLQRVERGPCSLNELFIVDGYISPSSPALSELLHSTKIEHFVVEDYRYAVDAERMQGLINALTHRDGETTSISLRKLTIAGCSCNPEAARLLTDFLQTRADRQTAEEKNTSLVSSLKELVFRVSDQRSSGLLQVRDMLCTQWDSNKREWCHTVGSLLKSVRVSHHRGLLDTMFRNAHRIHLTTLAVDVRDVSASLALCLAKVTSLRNLVIYSTATTDWSVPVQTMGRIMKTNGTLRSVTFEGQAVDTRLIDAYCQRNEHLDRLLDECSSFAKRNPHAPAAPQQLCPALLQAALPIPSRASSSLLSALMNLGESMGPDAESISSSPPRVRRATTRSRSSKRLRESDS